MDSYTMFSCARFWIEIVSILLLLFTHCVHSGAQNLVQTGPEAVSYSSRYLTDVGEVVLGMKNIDKLKKI
jgi:hypothetical protein